LMATDQERPDVIEQYQTAIQSKRLLMEEHRTGAVEVLVAAGWSPSRLGMGLLRVHSEWDGAAKPKRLTEAQVAVLAANFRADDAKAQESARMRGKQWQSQGKPETRAKAEAALWYRRELMLLAQSLKSRASVLEQLTQWAILRGIDPLIVGPALYWWLSSTCPVCDGHGVRKAEGAARLSAKRCNHCHGTGKVPHPEGSARVLAHIDYAVSVARGSLKKRLRNMR
jgi:hypothetical protein